MGGGGGIVLENNGGGEVYNRISVVLPCSFSPEMLCDGELTSGAPATDLYHKPVLLSSLLTLKYV